MSSDSLDRGLRPWPLPFARNFVLGKRAQSATPEQAGSVIFVKTGHRGRRGSAGAKQRRAWPSWSYETAETIAVVIKRPPRAAAARAHPRSTWSCFHAQADQRLRPLRCPTASRSPGRRWTWRCTTRARQAGRRPGARACWAGSCGTRSHSASAIGVDRPSVVRDRVQQSSDYRAYKVKIAGDPGRRNTEAITHRRRGGRRQSRSGWTPNQSYRPRRALRQAASTPGRLGARHPLRGTAGAR